MKSFYKKCTKYQQDEKPLKDTKSQLFKTSETFYVYFREQYTFLVITSQTLKIAFDFFKKLSAYSNCSSKSILLLKFSSPYSKQKGHFDYSICTVKRFLKVNLPFHASFSCKIIKFYIFQIAIESYLITVSDRNFQHKHMF